MGVSVMLGIGTDIVEVRRVREIKRIERFVRRVLHEDEVAIYNGFCSEVRRVEFLAGRFAAKEAVYKAIPDLCEGRKFSDFCILNDDLGKPYLREPEIPELLLSISHCREYAMAVAVIS